MKRVLFIIKFFFIAYNILLAVDIDRKSITIYHNLALIRETRKFKIEKGTKVYSFKYLSKSVQPDSIVVELPPDFTLIEKEFLLPEDYYFYKNISGKKINVITRAGRQIKGEFIEYKNGNFYIDSMKNSLIVIPEREIDSMEFPLFKYKKVDLSPELKLKISSKQNKEIPINISYLDSNLIWNAKYMGIINENEDKMRLECFASLENKTGTSFTNINLTLIAGEIRTSIFPTPRSYAVSYKEKKSLKTISPVPKEEELLDYHLYTFDFPVTIKHKSVKQIPLFSSREVKIKKQYVYESDAEVNVNIYIKFKNTKENNLGIPLPAGNIKIYQKKNKEEIYFIGGTSFRPLSEKEETKLLIGKAFDVKAKTITEVYEHSRSKSFYKCKVILKNRKDKDIKVIVIKKFYGDWELTDSTLEYKKIDAYTLEWEVSVKKKSETSFNYEYKIYFR